MWKSLSIRCLKLVGLVLYTTTYRRLALAEKQLLPKLPSFQRSWNIEYEQVHTEEGSRQGEDPRSWVAHCTRKITAGQQSDSPAHPKQKRQPQSNDKVLLQFAKASLATHFVLNIWSTQQADENENENDPVHNIDDAKGDEQANPE